MLIVGKGITVRLLVCLSACLSFEIRFHIHIEQRKIGFFPIDQFRKSIIQQTKINNDKTHCIIAIYALQQIIRFVNVN